MSARCRIEPFYFPPVRQVLELANHGLEGACQRYAALREGVNTYKGFITYKGVGESQGREWRAMAGGEEEKRSVDCVVPESPQAPSRPPQTQLLWTLCYRLANGNCRRTENKTA